MYRNRIYPAGTTFVSTCVLTLSLTFLPFLNAYAAGSMSVTQAVSQEEDLDNGGQSDSGIVFNSDFNREARAALLAADATLHASDTPHTLQEALRTPADPEFSAQAVGRGFQKQGDKNIHTQHAQTVRNRQVYGEDETESSEAALYLVQLNADPTALYQGGIDGLAGASRRAAGVRKFDSRSAESRAYQSYLAAQQDSFLRQAAALLAHELRVIYRYDTVYNGVAIVATPQEAQRLLEIEDVKSIQRSRLRQKLTDTTPGFLGAPAIWNGSAAGLPAAKGEGVIVGVIDTGIWPEHPSFSDDGAFPAPPASWHGDCQRPYSSATTYRCTNKLIGVQYFLDAYSYFFGYDGLFSSGRDDDGHGTHTASTAAGNSNVTAIVLNVNRGKISGMAPRAHVAAYKALGPSGGTTIDLVAAIEKATEDGVDVINYSVGSSFASDPWIDADAQAFLAASEAGIFVAASMGNAGPVDSTIGSPANAPWLTSVAANYANRVFLSAITLTASNGDSLHGLYGTSVNGVATNDFRLVSAVGITDTAKNVDGHCLEPFPMGAFSPGDIVLCEQGRGFSVNHVVKGGASGMIYSSATIPYDFALGLPIAPTVQVLNPVLRRIKQFMVDHPGQTISVSFTPGTAISAPDPRIPTDTVVGFSSRGPNFIEDQSIVLNTIKPDVSAPGIQILAGYSPQSVLSIDRDGDQQPGQSFAVIQGTSMSSPHIAGVAALLRQLHPDWSPAEMRSALMTTAIFDGLTVHDPDPANQNDALTNPADPFDGGAGRINIEQAARAAFVLDETADHFLASDPSVGGDPATLNLASLSQAKCMSVCSWVRTIKSTQNTPVAWNVAGSNTVSITLAITPSAFILLPGATQQLTITANLINAEIDKWSFAQVLFTPNQLSLPTAHFPVAVRASWGDFPKQLAIGTKRHAGSYKIGPLNTITIPKLEATLYGGTSQSIAATVSPDRTYNNPYDINNGGVYTMLLTVTEADRLLNAKIVESSAPDLDLYIGRDNNNDGLPALKEELCRSTSGGYREHCELSRHELTPGVFWLVVQNWRGSGSALDSFRLEILRIDANIRSPHLSVSAPTSVQAGTPLNLFVYWDDPALKPGQEVPSYLELYDHSVNRILVGVPLTLHYLYPDVTLNYYTAPKSDKYIQPGAVITYVLQIDPEQDFMKDMVRYTITNTLPNNVTLLSSTTPPTQMLANQQIVWSFDLNAQRHYRMTTSQNDPSCQNQYVDLESFGIPPEPTIQDDTVNVRFDDFYGSLAPVEFWGKSYQRGLYVAADGFLSLNIDQGPNPSVNTALPNPALPNNLIAPLWRDLSVVYDESANHGVTIAGQGSTLMAVEYDDVKAVNGFNQYYDFEVIMRRQPSDRPGAYEVIFAYDNLHGALTPATIGLENADGSDSVVVPNDAITKNGDSICFDWALDNKVIEYAVRVNDNTPLPAQLLNTIQHTVDISYSKTEVITHAVDMPDVILSAVVAAPESVAMEQDIVYQVIVSNTSVGIARNVMVTTTLPPGTAFVHGGQVDKKGVITLPLGDIGGKSSQQGEFAVRPRLLRAPFDNVVTLAATPAETGIVGGKQAKPGAWPWQAALLYARYASNFDAQYCAGSLIDPNWVLTAAHCVTNYLGNPVNPNLLAVGLGIHQLSNNEGRRVAVSQIVVHPEFSYNSISVHADLALLRLAEPVLPSGTPGTRGAIAPITLARILEGDLVADTKMAMVTGWGSLNAFYPVYADHLHQVTVPVVDNDICNKAYTKLGHRNQIDATMICAGFVEGGKDSCKGDSGGPLMALDRAGQWKQIGIVSSGYGCAEAEAYGIYVRVPLFINWIYGSGGNTFINAPIWVFDAQGHRAQTAARVTSTTIVNLPTAEEETQEPLLHRLLFPWVQR
jgi:uncharacterized repeat protein (TIGR01451 family)